MGLSVATIYLALGSNLGNREKNIKQAIEKLKKNNVIIKKISSIIETEPVGGPPQGKFLNAVLKAETTSSAVDLLNLLKNIEKQLGRKETVHHGPREIDIDILIYDKMKINTPDLTIPHPRMLQRDFVMTPLKEIEPSLVDELKK